MNTSTEQTLSYHGNRAKHLIQPLIGVVLLVWMIEVVDRLIFDGSLDRLGIAPRQLVGLRGIIFAPFLHGSFAHLLANTIPFLILSFFILIRQNHRFVAITAVIVLVSGLGTWVIGPANTIHIGASGVVFGYFAFLVVNAYHERSLSAIVMAALVILIYGSLLRGILPTNDGVSWQSHLFGLLGGVVAAHYSSHRRT